MGKIERDANWLKSEQFNLGNPLWFSITDVTQKEGKFGKQELTVFIKSDMDGEIYQSSVFGKNKNKLIDKLGDDTDKWIGKRVKILALTDTDKDTTTRTWDL